MVLEFCGVAREFVVYWLSAGVKVVSVVYVTFHLGRYRCSGSFLSINFGVARFQEQR